MNVISQLAIAFYSEYSRRNDQPKYRSKIKIDIINESEELLLTSLPVTTIPTENNVYEKELKFDLKIITGGKNIKIINRCNNHYKIETLKLDLLNLV